MKNRQKSNDQELDKSPETLRRDFLKKFGVSAIGLPVVTYTLMSPITSKATAASGVVAPGGASAPGGVVAPGGSAPGGGAPGGGAPGGGAPI